MSKHESKTCPRCQKKFECCPGNIIQCQCYGLKLTDELRQYMDQRYADCLCRDCLEFLSVELNLFKEKYVFK